MWPHKKTQKLDVVPVISDLVTNASMKMSAISIRAVMVATVVTTIHHVVTNAFVHLAIPAKIVSLNYLLPAF